MPNPGLSDGLAREAANAYWAAGCNRAQAARDLGLRPKTFDGRLDRALARGFVRAGEGASDPDVPLPELLDRMTADFERAQAAADATRLIQVKLLFEGRSRTSIHTPAVTRATSKCSPTSRTRSMP